MTTTPGTDAAATTPIPDVPVLPHWVAGAEHRGSRDRFSDVTNPATGDVTARLSLGFPQNA